NRVAGRAPELAATGGVGYDSRTLNGAAQPLVSAIVVNWNGGEMLRDCLASLFAQTHAALEVILVDNGSADGEAALAQATYGDRLRVITNRKNEGFARGNNLA